MTLKGRRGKQSASTTTTTTIISGGPTRFDQRGVTLQRASHHGQARNTLSSFQFQVLPIPASRPMPSGHFMCMALPPTEDTRPDDRGSKRRRAPQGDLCNPNGHRPDAVRISSAALAARWPRGNPRGSTEPTADARQTLSTVRFGRHMCVKPYKSLYILHIASEREN